LTLRANVGGALRKAEASLVRYAFPIMNYRRIALPFALALAACNREPPAADPVPAASMTHAAPRPPVEHLGAAISAPEVALADVAKDPASFAGRPFTTRGTVTAVCQEMGCWMEIKDADNGAHLRMHGHSFFVPKTASGRKARVEATLVSPGAAPACNEPECAPKNLALLQLDAAGVELD